ncbi:MAG: hypothetical protein KDC53_01030 [Saprospiraceae bacterium]|nr:hypothetical protein [Saprospiraceae bacterium]
MVNQHIQQLLAEGDELVHFAGNELARSRDDVVTFLACNNIKRGINFFLQAFIESYRRDPPQHPTPEGLLEMCTSIDSHFKDLDFKPLECAGEKGANNYCLDIDHVEECLVVAKETQSMVLKRINA